MSSYSEYLSRSQQRLTKYVDTRPHRSAGHQTEILKRVAASTKLELTTTNSICASTTDFNSQPNQKVISGGHSVQDTSSVLDYNAGQAVAQGLLPANAKASQITSVCYSRTQAPEFNDKLAADPQLALKQAAKNALRNCCQTCKKVVFASGCACTGSKAFKTTAS